MTKEELDAFGVAVYGDPFNTLYDKGKVIFLTCAFVVIVERVIREYVNASNKAD